MSSVSPVSPHLLDRRYRIMAALPGQAGERHFAARHVELDIPVRIISVWLGDQHGVGRQQAAERFLARAAAAVALRHPGIVRVRDVFRQGATFTLVVDWTPRDTLASRLAEHGPIPLREALALGLHLCDLLGAVAQHAPPLLPLGTLAPETLALLPGGHYVLTDLGIRNWFAGYSPRQSTGEVPCSTTGSPPGKTPDARSDISSVAAILFSALTGAPAPSAARNANRPPLCALAPEVPPLVSATIERALQPNAADSYATPEAFGAALGAAVQRTLPDAVAPARPTRPSRPACPARPLDFPPPLRRQKCSNTANRELPSGSSGHTRQRHAAAHELLRVAAPIPLRRTGERALAALSSALRLGA